MNEQEFDIDVTERFPSTVLDLDIGNDPEQTSSKEVGMPKHLTFTKGQDIKLKVRFRKVNPGSIPPSFVPVDITGWKVRWTLRDKDNDDDGNSVLIFSSLVGPLGDPLNGEVEFSIPGADFDPDLPFERSPSQFKIHTDGLDATPPEIVEDVQVTAHVALADS